MRILIEEHQYQAEQIRDVLHGIDAMQLLDQLQVMPFLTDRGMNSLHKTRLPHPARAPQKRIVRGQPLRKVKRVLRMRGESEAFVRERIANATRLTDDLFSGLGDAEGADK